jgi:hypothetical protein
VGLQDRAAVPRGVLLPPEQVEQRRQTAQKLNLGRFLVGPRLAKVEMTEGVRLRLRTLFPCFRSPGQAE